MLELPIPSENDFKRLLSGCLPHLENDIPKGMNNVQRVDALNIEAAGIHFDFSRTHLNEDLVEWMAQFMETVGVGAWMRALHDGDIVNPSEGQAASHCLYRLNKDRLGQLVKEREEASAIIEASAKCRSLVERFRSNEWLAPNGKPYRHLIHLGIGGSALGPKLLIDCLGYGKELPIEAHFVANIDGHSLAPTLAACDPAQTMVIVCSKTFTTLETLHNAAEAQAWMRAAGIERPLDQFVGISAKPGRIVEFGISEDRALSFPQTIGGRYSVWSAVGLPAMLALGIDVFDEFLAGGGLMDECFFSNPLENNPSMLAGALDACYRHCADMQTIALFCYDQRLQLFPGYCQQLYMESNGKDRDRRGARLRHASAPVLWGGVGTEAQHAVFQLLHQGTGLHLPDFIAVARPGHDLADSHQHLLANMLAQASALAKGRHQIDGRDETVLDFVESSKLFVGNRPSVSLFLPDLSPATLGALIAHYEHRTFVSGILWGVNVFDQMGVELGKEMAQNLYPMLDGQEQVHGLDAALTHNIATLNKLSTS